MEVSQDDQFLRIVHLWNECQSNQNKHLPYPSIPQIGGNGRFSNLKMLMNMMFVSFERIQSEMSPSPNPTKQKCRMCPALRDELLKKEQRLYEIEEECTSLSKKLELQNVQKEISPFCTPSPSRRQLRDAKDSDKKSKVNRALLLSPIPIPCATSTQNQLNLESPPKPQNGYVSDDCSFSSVDIFLSTPENEQRRKKSSEKGERRKAEDTTANDYFKSKTVRLASWTNNAKTVVSNGDKSSSKNQKQLKRTKQTTLKSSFAKQQVPRKTLDLTTLPGFDGGLRNGSASANFTKSTATSTSTWNIETKGVVRVPSQSTAHVEIPQKTEQPEVDDHHTVEADETFFVASPPRPQQCQPLPSTSKGIRPTIADFGNATLDVLQNFDKIPEVEASSPEFAYKPGRAIRKKDERAKLPGWDCDMCRQYYTSLQSQYSEEQLKKLKNNCSKHRSKHPANLNGTQAHYWDIDFPSTEECIEKGFLGQGHRSPR